MRTSVLFLCLFLANIASGATTPVTIWLSTRTDGIVGTGTQSDPIDLSTPAKFDAFFAARYAAYYQDSSSYDAVIFRFLPGTYTSNSTGIWAVSGWQLIGAGQGSTILKFPALTYASSSAKRPVDMVDINTNWGSTDITVQDMTIDGGVRDTGIPISAGFVMPAPRKSVTITVPDASKLMVGKWYYVQDSAMTNNKQMWWGIVTCTAISGNSVTLQNAEVATAGTVTGDTTAGSPIVRNISSTNNLEASQSITGGGSNNFTATIASVDSSKQITLAQNATVTASGVTISYATAFTGNVSGQVLSSAYLFPAGNRSGVILQSNNILVERVTVQDVAIPFYEGSAGIELGNQPRTHKVGSGNVIDSCTIQDMFGIYASYIAANSVNNFIGDDGTTEQVNITNNTVIGNGYYLGIGLAGNSNSTISGNKVSNVGVGFFCDTGYSTGITITGNTFSGASGIHIGVGAPGYFNNCVIKNNIITMTTSGGTGISLSLNSSNLTVSNNIVTISSPSVQVWGIVAANLDSDVSGNVIANNQIVSSIGNQGVDTSANQILTFQQINAELAAGNSDTTGTDTASTSATTSTETTDTASTDTTSAAPASTTTASTGATTAPTNTASTDTTSSTTTSTDTASTDTTSVAPASTTTASTGATTANTSSATTAPTNTASTDATSSTTSTDTADTSDSDSTDTTTTAKATVAQASAPTSAPAPSSAPAPASTSQSAPISVASVGFSGSTAKAKNFVKAQIGLAQRMNDAVAIMQEMSSFEGKRGETSGYVGISDKDKDSKMAATDEVTEKKMVLQLDALVRQLNDEQNLPK